MQTLLITDDRRVLEFVELVEQTVRSLPLNQYGEIALWHNAFRDVLVTALRRRGLDARGEWPQWYLSKGTGELRDGSVDLCVVGPTGRPEIVVEIERSSRRMKSYQKLRLAVTEVLEDLGAEPGTVNVIRITQLSSRPTTSDR